MVSCLLSPDDLAAGALLERRDSVSELVTDRKVDAEVAHSFTMNGIHELLDLVPSPMMRICTAEVANSANKTSIHGNLTAQRWLLGREDAFLFTIDQPDVTRLD